MSEAFRPAKVDRLKGLMLEMRIYLDAGEWEQANRAFVRFAGIWAGGQDAPELRGDPDVVRAVRHEHVWSVEEPA